MTAKFSPLILLIACTLISAGLFAQLTKVKVEGSRPRVPAWVSEIGYWVVESNTHSPSRHIVLFYNNDNVLMYKETLEGIKLDPQKRRVKMKLKKALEASARTWQSAPGSAGNDQSIVMTALR